MKIQKYIKTDRVNTVVLTYINEKRETFWDYR